MRFPIEKHHFLGFFPPYRTVEVLDRPGQVPVGPLPNRGAVLIWNMATGTELGPRTPSRTGLPASPSS